MLAKGDAGEGAAAGIALEVLAFLLWKEPYRVLCRGMRFNCLIQAAFLRVIIERYVAGEVVVEGRRLECCRR